MTGGGEMRIEVSDADGLHALYATYLKLCGSGEASTLEVVLAPGRYGESSIGPIRLDLDGPDDRSGAAIDLIVRGASSTAPAVLDDIQVKLTGRRIVLENLVLTGRRDALLRARVGERFEMRRCRVTDNGIGGPWGGKLIELAGVPGRSGFGVALVDTWFVGNRQVSPAAMMTISPASGGGLKGVDFERVVMVDNHFSADVAMLASTELRAVDCLLHKRRFEPPGGPPVALVHASLPRRLRFEGCALALDDGELLAPAPPGEPATDGPPVRLVGGRVRLGEGATIAGAALDGVAVETGAAFDVPPTPDASAPLSSPARADFERALGFTG